MKFIYLKYIFKLRIILGKVINSQNHWKLAKSGFVKIIG